MTGQDETASVSASQRSSHAQSIKDEIAKDGLAPEHLESLYTDLPSDATALKAIVGTMRLELSKKDTTITKLKEEMDEVKASHSVVLQRSAEWQDELETLRLRVPQLEQELRNEKQAREAESDRVKDLRIRAEESRRAIMRLQGEQSDARAKAKVDNRRSWIPAATNPPPVRDEQQEAELKKSKRASLAFGPNALNLNSLATRPGSSHGFGHRRTASGGRSVSGVSGASKGDAEGEEEPLSPTFANGLRGLRLSGTAGMNGTMTSNSLLTPNAAAGGDDNGSAPNSRRSSFRSDAGKSPSLGLNDLPLPDGADVSSSLGARLSVPSAASGPSGQRNSLLSSPALSQGAASSVGVGSPIIEDTEEEESHHPNSTSSAKALPNLPTRESSIPSLQSHDRELRAKEVEIERLTREMTEMRLSMEEALEARKASEACLKALRDFIAHHDEEADAEAQMGYDADRIVQRASFGAGLLKGVKLPPLPTDDMDEKEEAAHVKASSLSPQKQSVGMGGWGMKLPTLMRKATSSSSAGGAGSNGPTPSDERSGMSPSSEGETGLGLGQDSAAPAPPPKSIASGFAGFSNLLARSSTSTTPNDQNPPSNTSTTTTSASEAVSPPQPSSDDAASAFKPFGWFKRTSVLGPASSSTTTSTPSTQETIEEKVLSPPFRSLDHDQLSISRQSVILPSHPPFDANDATPTTSTSASSLRTPSGSGSNGALAMAARIADEENAKKVAESVKNKDPQMSHRAQRAAKKTESVEHLTDVLPSFD